VALRRSGLLVARGSFSTAAGHLAAPRMRLNVRGRALLRRRHRLAVEVAVGSRDASGRARRTTVRVLLRG
jgi:hypothetical protein